MPDQQLTDPLGRTVVLHDHTWFGHIVVGHQEVSRDRPQVELAIQSPEEIQFSASDPDCRIYYGKPTISGRRLVVVADVVQGIVKTAYAAKRKKAGAVEWSR